MKNKYNPILKKKVECKLCDIKNKLTYHHIIPKREILFNGYDNIMILCRKCHNIIDVNIKQRDDNCYNKNKIIIDAYNKILIENKFDDDLLWKIYEENKIIVKKKKKPIKRRKDVGLNLNCVNLDEYKTFRDAGKLNRLLDRKSKPKYVQ